VLFMVLMMSPFYVGACSPARTPGGFYVELEDCTRSNGLETQVFFDILVKKEEIPYRVDRGSISGGYYWQTIDQVYDDNKELLSFDNEWVSYSAYYPLSEEYTDFDNCSVTFESDYWETIETQFSEFKVVAFSKDNGLLSITNPISTSIMLFKDVDEYKKVIYNADENYFYLANASFDWSEFTPGCTGIIYGSLFNVSAILLIATILLLTLFEAFAISSKGRDSQLAAIVGSLNLSILLMYWLFFTTNSGVIRWFSLITIVGSFGYKFYEINKRNSIVYWLSIGVTLFMLFSLFMMSLSILFW